MILSSIQDSSRYENINPLFSTGFSFLKDHKTIALEDGRYELEGDDLYAVIFRYNCKSAEDAIIENHKNYIDIQYIAAGKESMGWASSSCNALALEPYDPKRDVQFYDKMELNWFQISTGQFAIFFPEDIHSPGVGNGHVHKIVLKVKI